ncbi:unnamed protein product, partial [Mesorhabditis spiculigera]
MAKRFERSLAAATDPNSLDTDWDAVLDCVDQIRGGETKAREGMSTVLKRLASDNPHVQLHCLILLEAMVKNCGKKVHSELATREFMEGVKNLAIEAKAEKVKNKVLELLQCWAMAFANKQEYKIVVDTHNLMKLAGFDFPSVKESDAMFAAQVAPEWEDGPNCFRCRNEFGFLTRKHHCRACGQIFCAGCSSKEMLLPQYGIEKPVRVCDGCFEKGIGVPLGKQASSTSRGKTVFPAVREREDLAYLNLESRSPGQQVSSRRELPSGRRRAASTNREPSLFKNVLRGLFGLKQPEEQPATTAPQTADPENEERERQARLQREKDEEEYQLQMAMAISQSEAEAKEKERATSLYSFYNGVKDQSVNSPMSTLNDSASIAPSENIGIYKGAADVVRESPSENSLNADDPLARYLNRDYWQQRKENADEKVENWEFNPSAPLPSEPSLGGGSCAPTIRGSPTKDYVYPVSAEPSADDDTLRKVEETKKFCADVNEQVYFV